jgi:hypothetical protein
MLLQVKQVSSNGYTMVDDVFFDYVCESLSKYVPN